MLTLRQARALRVLALNHIFVEIKPDVFANNRNSSVLDTGKSVGVIQAEYVDMYHQTSLRCLTTPPPALARNTSAQTASSHSLVYGQSQVPVARTLSDIRSTDEGLKSSAYLSDTIFDPKLAFSQEPTETALNTAFKTDLSFYPWYEATGNEHRRLRFNLGMDGSKNATNPNVILEGTCGVEFYLLRFKIIARPRI